MTIYEKRLTSRLDTASAHYGAPPGANPLLPPEVVTVAGLHYEIFLLGDDEMNFVVADCVAFVRGVREAVLVAQIFLNLGVNLVDRLLLGHLEKAPARFLGYLLEDFLAVWALFLPRIPAFASATTSATAHWAADAKPAGTTPAFLVRK